MELPLILIYVLRPSYVSLAQPKSDVHDLALALDAKRESAFLEHFQHRAIIWQDFGDQFLESASPGNRGEMMHESRAETLPLILIDHSERDLGLSRLHDDVTCAARDHRPAGLLHHGDEGHVIDEVDVQEESHFLLREAAFHGEEAAVQGLGAGAADRG